jgi:hypothetical protein
MFSIMAAGKKMSRSKIRPLFGEGRGRWGEGAHAKARRRKDAKDLWWEETPYYETGRMGADSSKRYTWARKWGWPVTALLAIAFEQATQLPDVE